MNVDVGICLLYSPLMNLNLLCEVLMSSHRDYEKDLEWSWLRNDGLGLQLLRFELASDSGNMYELIVDKDWWTRVSLTILAYVSLY